MRASLLPACAVAVVALCLAGNVAAGADAPAVPDRVVITDHYTLPILWDGREIGRRTFEPGREVRVVSRSGGFLECRDGAQTFRLPVSVTDFESRLPGARVTPPATAEAAPKIAPEPAPTPSPKPEPTPLPEAAPKPGPAAPTNPEPAPAATRPSLPPAPPSLQRDGAAANPNPPPVPVTAYLESLRRLMTEKPANARYYAYQALRAAAPPADFRREVGRLVATAAPGSALRSAAEHWKSAMLCYDLGRWPDFERAMQEGDAALR